jgi:hypothetical protein
VLPECADAAEVAYWQAALTDRAATGELLGKLVPQRPDNPRRPLANVVLARSAPAVASGQDHPCSGRVACDGHRGIRRGVDSIGRYIGVRVICSGIRVVRAVRSDRTSGSWDGCAVLGKTRDVSRRGGETVAMMIGQVVDRFELGEAVGPPVPVSGGLSNDLWRLETERGTFAVKRMVVNADRPDFVANLEAAFVVEARAFAAGVPMPAPVPDPATGRALVRVGGDLVRVHAWVAGVAGEDSVGEASALLARIHAASAARWVTCRGRGWRATGWGDGLAALARRVADGPARLLEVDSHGDLDRKDTLRRCADGILMAVDWDAADAVPAVHDVVRVAVDWAGTEPSAFRAAIKDYQEVAAVEIPAEPWVFAGWVNALGGWLDYNAGQRAGTELGDAEVATTLGRLSQLAADFDLMMNALS